MARRGFFPVSIYAHPDDVQTINDFANALRLDRERDMEDPARVWDKCASIYGEAVALQTHGPRPT